MKKGLMLLADGFEITEALTTVDILKRTHVLACSLASIGGSNVVTSSCGVQVLADSFLSEVRPGEYDFLILPGGKLGVENLKDCPKVLEAVLDFYKNGKGVYAICAAPSILGMLDILDGKKYTCFPGFQCGKGEYVDAPCVEDGGVITGHSMAFTIPFAEAIAKKEAGLEALELTYPGTRGIAK